MNFLKRLLDFFKRDRCVSCGRKTRYRRSTHINKRKHYIEGAGQLCDECGEESILE